MLEKKQVVGGSVARGNFAADPVPEPISEALRELFIDTKVGQSTVLLLWAALGCIGIVLVFLLTVFVIDVLFHGLYHSCVLCHSCGCGVCCLLAGCSSVDDGMILVCGHSYDEDGMVCTGRV